MSNANEDRKFSQENISAEIIRRREAGLFTLETASNLELLTFDVMLSTRRILAGLEEAAETIEKVSSGTSLLKMAKMAGR